jgi:membrane-associated protein
MPYRRFLAANVVGALTWAAGLVLLGYYAYEVPWLRRTAIAVAAASVLVFVVVVLARWRRARRLAKDSAPRGDRRGPTPSGRTDL